MDHTSYDKLFNNACVSTTVFTLRAELRDAKKRIEELEERNEALIKGLKRAHKKIVELAPKEPEPVVHADWKEIAGKHETVIKRLEVENIGLRNVINVLCRNYADLHTKHEQLIRDL